MACEVAKFKRTCPAPPVPKTWPDVQVARPWTDLLGHPANVDGSLRTGNGQGCLKPGQVRDESQIRSWPTEPVAGRSLTSASCGHACSDQPPEAAGCGCDRSCAVRRSWPLARHRLVPAASSSEPPASVGLARRPVGAWRQRLVKQGQCIWDLRRASPQYG